MADRTNCTVDDVFQSLFDPPTRAYPSDFTEGTLVFLPLIALVATGTLHLFVQPTEIPWLRAVAPHTRRAGVLVSAAAGIPLCMLVYRTTDIVRRCGPYESIVWVHIPLTYIVPSLAVILVVLHLFVAWRPAVGRAALLFLANVCATASIGAFDTILRRADACTECASSLPAAQIYAAALGAWVLAAFPRYRTGIGAVARGTAPLSNWLGRNGVSVLQTRAITAPAHLQGEL